MSWAEVAILLSIVAIVLCAVILVNVAGGAD